MKLPALSVIVPTIGRPGLAELLASLPAAGIRRTDELVVVGDGDPPAVRRMLDEAAVSRACRLVYRPLVPAGGCVGQPARNLGVATARAPWLVFSQDDNVLLPAALTVVRRIVAAEAPRPHMFKVIPACGVPVPFAERVAEGYIDGDCAVMPNVPGKLGAWGNRYQGDYDWIMSTLVHYPDGPAWHEELIAAQARHAYRLGLLGPRAA